MWIAKPLRETLARKGVPVYHRVWDPCEQDKYIFFFSLQVISRGQLELLCDGGSSAEGGKAKPQKNNPSLQAGNLCFEECVC